MYDPLDPYGQKQRSNIFRHVGFHVGFIAGVMMIVVHIILLLLNGWTNRGDLLAWIIAWFVYFLAGRAAGQQQYELDRDELDPTMRVRGAAVGAAIVCSLLVWVFIVVRSIMRDAVGIQVLVDTVGLYCYIVVDVLIAIGMASWAARGIINKYKTDTLY